MKPYLIKKQKKTLLFNYEIIFDVISFTIDASSTFCCNLMFFNSSNGQATSWDSKALPTKAYINNPVRKKNLHV